MSNVFTMGIDVGSTASKCVILKDGKEIVAKSVISVGTGTSGPARAMKEALEQVGLSSVSELQGAVATGYGRNSLAEVPAQMSELSCHAKGAYFLFPNVHSIIDIGGQDSKALKIGDNGMLENFVMNDKCAAGTGRFLDVIAKVLEVNKEYVDVRCIEAFNSGISVDEEFSVTKDVVSAGGAPELNVDDNIRVVFNGDVMESDPLQIGTVYAIYLLDENGEVIPNN